MNKTFLILKKNTCLKNKISVNQECFNLKKKNETSGIVNKLKAVSRLFLGMKR